MPSSWAQQVWARLSWPKAVCARAIALAGPAGAMPQPSRTIRQARRMPSSCGPGGRVTGRQSLAAAPERRAARVHPHQVGHQGPARAAAADRPRLDPAGQHRPSPDAHRDPHAVGHARRAAGRPGPAPAPTAARLRTASRRGARRHVASHGPSTVPAPAVRRSFAPAHAASPLHAKRGGRGVLLDQCGRASNCIAVHMRLSG